MKIPHIDYRKSLPNSYIFCRKCGDVYLVEWIEKEQKFGAVCTHCGEVE
jgi:hypothetical protein